MIASGFGIVNYCLTLRLTILRLSKLFFSLFLLMCFKTNNNLKLIKHTTHMNFYFMYLAYRYKNMTMFRHEHC